MIGRVILASAGAIWLAAEPQTASAAPQGVPVILYADGGQSCLFPTVSENIEIRDVSAEVAVTGPPLANQEILLTSRTRKPSEGQSIFLPLVQTSPSGQIYNVHASVLFFGFADATIELAITSSIAGQTINLTNCTAAGWQGFPT